MPMGPGKYDAEVTELRQRLKANGILLLVVQGERGSGFSAQLSGEDVLACRMSCVNLLSKLRKAGSTHETLRLPVSGRDRALIVQRFYYSFT